MPLIYKYSKMPTGLEHLEIKQDIIKNIYFYNILQMFINYNLSMDELEQIDFISNSKILNVNNILAINTFDNIIVNIESNNLNICEKLVEIIINNATNL